MVEKNRMEKSKNVLDFRGDKLYAGNMRKNFPKGGFFKMQKWTSRIETPDQGRADLL